MKMQVHGVFVRGREENPIALYSDPRAARLHAVEGAAAVVLPLEVTVSAASLKAAEEELDAGQAPVAPAVDVERERIRAEVVTERRTARIRNEIAAELDAAEKPDKGGKD